jgi:hypothetical protein
LTETEKVKIILDAEDPDGDKMTFSSGELPYRATLKGNVFEYIPDYETVQKHGNLMNKIVNALHLDNIYYKDAKTFDVLLTASGKDRSTNQTLKIAVKNVNRAPKLLEIDPVTIKEGETVKLHPVAVDPDNDRLHLWAASILDKRFVWKTNFNDNGDYKINITVTDGEFSDTKTARVIVENVNRLPALEVKDIFNVNENSTMTVPILAKDPDNDQVEMYIENPINGISMRNGTLVYNPGYDVAEKGKVTEVVATIVAYDYSKTPVRKSIMFKVKDVNRAPKLINSTPKSIITIKVGEPVIFRANAADADNDELSYEWKFGLFDSVKGPNAIKRTFTTSGVKTLKLVISDGRDSIIKQWTINVKPKTVVKKAVQTVKTTTAATTAKTTVQASNTQVTATPKQTTVSTPQATVIAKQPQTIQFVVDNNLAQNP